MLKDACYPVLSPPPPRYTNRDACYPVFSPPPFQVHKQRLLLPCILTSPLPGTQTETPVTLYSHLPSPRYTNRDSCYPVFSPPPSQVHKQKLLLPYIILTSPLPGTQTETPVTLYSHLPSPRYTNRDSSYPVFSPPLLPGTQTETPVTLYSHLPLPRYTNRDSSYPVFSPPLSQVHKQRLQLPCILTSPLPGTQIETPVTLYSHLPSPRYTNRDSCYPVFSPPPSQVHKQRLLLPCILTSPLPGTQTETPVTLYSHLPPPRYTNRDSCYPVFSPPPSQVHKQGLQLPCIITSPLPGTQTETPVTLYSHLPPPRYTNRDACYPVFSPPPSQVHKQRRLLPCILTSPLPGTQTKTPVTLYSHLPLPGTQTETPVTLYSHLPPSRYTNRDSCYPVFSPPPSQVHKQRRLLPCILTSPLPGTQTETPVTLYSHLPPPRYTNRNSCYPR